MNQTNPIETWLTAVAYSHSQSKSTEHQYKKNMQDYCKFTQTTPNKILTEYETTDEKTFKRKHSQQIQQWITKLYNQKLAITTIRTKIVAIKSFYKYQSLPLGYIPQAQETITYHNRDIETKEIAQIIALSPLREKAFYALMAQSGLRPCVIQQIQIKEIENLIIEQPSYKIDIPKNKEKGHAGEHPSFIGEDARKYLRQYLTTRTNLTPNNLLFCAYKKPNTPINIKNTSRSFQTTTQKLQKTGTINYEIRKGKPSELHLYTLRKFFKRKCKDMGDEDTNYLMGHIIVGSNKNYRPQNPEYYRKRYEDKALPFLQLETPTPSDTKELMTTLKEQHQKEIEKRDNENKELKDQLTKIQEELQTVKENIKIMLPVTALFKELTEMTKEDEEKFNQALKEKELKERKQLKNLIQKIRKTKKTK
jgi:integrase